MPTFEYNRANPLPNPRFEGSIGYGGGVASGFYRPTTLRNVGGLAYNGGSVTGALLIQVAGDTLAWPMMLNAVVHNYNYSSSTTWGGAGRIHFGGYCYENTYGVNSYWPNTSVEKFGSMKQMSFYFLAKGSGGNDPRFAIQVGTTTSVWSYPAVTVDLLTAGRASDINQDWIVSWETDLSAWRAASPYIDYTAP